MSRGPGKWQRGILDALEAHPVIWLRDLLPRPCRSSEYQALYRAALTLFDVGKIGIWRSRFSHSPLAIARIGVDASRLSEIPRLSVESGFLKTRLNTYEVA